MKQDTSIQPPVSEPPATEPPGWLSKLGWFVGIWLASVLALGLVSMLLRAVL